MIPDIPNPIVSAYEQVRAYLDTLNGTIPSTLPTRAPATNTAHIPSPARKWSAPPGAQEPKIPYLSA